MEDLQGSQMTYLRMMADILGKKEQILTQLLQLTEEQTGLIKEETFREDAFAQLMDQKEVLIGKVLESDQGFQAIYNRIEKELQTNQETYKEKILELQGLITRVSDLGIRLQALERSNKASMEVLLGERKKGIRQFKVSKKTADSYYKNMIGMQKEQSYFMDRKR